MIEVRSAATRADFDEASALYVDAFGYGPEMSLNPLLLSAIVANGGSAVGAYEEGRLAGFAYSFVGYDGGEPFAYSQAAFVRPGLQGQGIGRRIKQEQRRLALAAGLRTMRWAFEPLKVRNAHFNLDVLGAVVRRLERDYYGTPGSHRLIAEWDLTREHRPRPAVAPPVGPGERVADGDAIWLGVPGEGAVEVLAGLLAEGRVARSCLDAGGGTFAYRLCRER